MVCLPVPGHSSSLREGGREARQEPEGRAACYFMHAAFSPARELTAKEAVEKPWRNAGSLEGSRMTSFLIHPKTTS